MNLSKLCIQSKIHWRSNFSGLDCYDQCIDKGWFTKYPYNITYEYNSKGFRGPEWPDDLHNAIWCVGDSFTAGIGCPLEHTWPYVLEKKIGIKTINISMDGASNDFIANMSTEISSNIRPIAIIHQWSYLHRRGNQSSSVHYSRTTEQEDIDHFVKSVISTDSSTPTIHSFIPKFEPGDSPTKLLIEADLAKKTLKQLDVKNVVYDNVQIDYARDGHHYDINTASKYVSYYLDFLNLL